MADSPQKGNFNQNNDGTVPLKAGTSNGGSTPHFNPPSITPLPSGSNQPDLSQLRASAGTSGQNTQPTNFHTPVERTGTQSTSRQPLPPGFYYGPNGSINSTTLVTDNNTNARSFTPGFTIKGPENKKENSDTNPSTQNQPVKQTDKVNLALGDINQTVEFTSKEGINQEPRETIRQVNTIEGEIGNLTVGNITQVVKGTSATNVELVGLQGSRNPPQSENDSNPPTPNPPIPPQFDPTRKVDEYSPTRPLPIPTTSSQNASIDRAQYQAGQNNSSLTSAVQPGGSIPFVDQTPPPSFAQTIGQNTQPAFQFNRPLPTTSQQAVANRSTGSPIESTSSTSAFIQKPRIFTPVETQFIRQAGDTVVTQNGPKVVQRVQSGQITPEQGQIELINAIVQEVATQARSNPGTYPNLIDETAISTSIAEITSSQVRNWLQNNGASDQSSRDQVEQDYKEPSDSSPKKIIPVIEEPVEEGSGMLNPTLFQADSGDRNPQSVETQTDSGTISTSRNQGFIPGVTSPSQNQPNSSETLPGNGDLGNTQSMNPTGPGSSLVFAKQASDGSPNNISSQQLGTSSPTSDYNTPNNTNDQTPQSPGVNSPSTNNSRPENSTSPDLDQDYPESNELTPPSDANNHPSSSTNDTLENDDYGFLAPGFVPSEDIDSPENQARRHKEAQDEVNSISTDPREQNRREQEDYDDAYRDLENKSLLPSKGEVDDEYRNLLQNADPNTLNDEERLLKNPNARWTRDENTGRILDLPDASAIEDDVSKGLRPKKDLNPGFVPLSKLSKPDKEHVQSGSERRAAGYGLIASGAAFNLALTDPNKLGTNPDGTPTDEEKEFQDNQDTAELAAGREQQELDLQKQLLQPPRKNPFLEAALDRIKTAIFTTIFPWIAATLVPILLFMMLFLGGLVAVYCTPIRQVRDPLEIGILTAQTLIDPIKTTLEAANQLVINGVVRSPLRIALEENIPGCKKAVNCAPGVTTAAVGSGAGYNCASNRIQMSVVVPGQGNWNVNIADVRYQPDNPNLYYALIMMRSQEFNGFDENFVGGDRDSCGPYQQRIQELRPGASLASAAQEILGKPITMSCAELVKEGGNAFFDRLALARLKREGAYDKIAGLQLSPDGNGMYLLAQQLCNTQRPDAYNVRLRECPINSYYVRRLGAAGIEYLKMNQFEKRKAGCQGQAGASQPATVTKAPPINPLSLFQPIKASAAEENTIEIAQSNSNQPSSQASSTATSGNQASQSTSSVNPTAQISGDTPSSSCNCTDPGLSSAPATPTGSSSSSSSSSKLQTTSSTRTTSWEPTTDKLIAFSTFIINPFSKATNQSISAFAQSKYPWLDASGGIQGSNFARSGSVGSLDSTGGGIDFTITTPGSNKAAGTPVVAIADGVITDVQGGRDENFDKRTGTSRRGFGNRVAIFYPSLGITVDYAHNESVVSIPVGTQVKAGTLLAKQGASGSTNGTNNLPGDKGYKGFIHISMNIYKGQTDGRGGSGNPNYIGNIAAYNDFMNKMMTYYNQNTDKIKAQDYSPTAGVVGGTGASCLTTPSAGPVTPADIKNCVKPTPGAGNIRSKFGMRFHPIRKVMRLHAGIDTSDGTGTPVVACADGVVKFAGSGAPYACYGNIVVIDHGGWESRSAHLSTISVKSGQTVKSGMGIGAVGGTGCVTGPHLHYEIRTPEPIDPCSVVSWC